MTTRHQVDRLPVNQIRANEENPRLHFPELTMDDLAASIDQVGVLVPISVYEDRETDSDRPYVLIDGERRFRTAGRLGHDDIPAIVLPQPDDTENLLTMFHIHMVREAWDDMPTAWALEKLMDRTGTTDVDELSRLTRISKRQIERLQFALSLPADYQALIDAGQIPLNFFFELHENVIRPLQAKRPAIFAKFGEQELLRAFLEKREANALPDLIELRKVRPIINAAADDAGGPESPSELDGAIERLITRRDATIQEAYEDTVEILVEADKFARQCQSLVRRFDRLVARAEVDEEKQLIVDSAAELAAALRERLEAVPASE